MDDTDKKSITLPFQTVPGILATLFFIKCIDSLDMDLWASFLRTMQVCEASDNPVMGWDKGGSSDWSGSAYCDDRLLVIQQATEFGGYFTMLDFLPRMIMSPVFAAVSDSYGRKVVVLVSIAGSLVLFTCVYIASILQVKALILVGGFIHGCTYNLHGVSVAMMADASSKSQRTSFISSLTLVNTAGTAIALVASYGLLSAYLTSYSDIWLALMIGALVLLCFVSAFVQETLKEEQRVPFEWKNCSPVVSLRLYWHNPFLMLMALSVLFLLMGIVGLIVTLGPFILVIHGFTQAQAVFPALAMNLAAVLFLPISSLLSDKKRLQPAATLRLGFVVILIGLWLLAFLAPFSLEGVWIGVVVIGMGFGLSAPAGNSLITCAVSDTDQAQSQAAMSVFAILGLGIAAPVFANVLFHADATGLQASIPFFVASCLIVLAIILLQVNMSMNKTFLARILLDRTASSSSSMIELHLGESSSASSDAMMMPTDARSDAFGRDSTQDSGSSASVSPSVPSSSSSSSSAHSSSGSSTGSADSSKGDLNITL